MKIVKYVFVSLCAVVLCSFLAIHYFTAKTEEQIARLQARIVDLSKLNEGSSLSMETLDQLPEPVQRYFEYVFKNPVRTTPNYVHIEASGLFRRPLKTHFESMNAEQYISIGTPALMFSATTSVAPYVWARAYDYFENGKMEMKAKILSTLTVVDESETPKLNQISLRRWLLESTLYPHALLPGGHVTWKPIDQNSSLAIVEIDGMKASMIAHFDEIGRLTYMESDEMGDLNTPYHGSGEHVTRTDYKEVSGIMIPHSFTISRADGKNIFPFWKGEVTKINFY